MTILSGEIDIDWVDKSITLLFLISGSLFSFLATRYVLLKNLTNESKITKREYFIGIFRKINKLHEDDNLFTPPINKQEARDTIEKMNIIYNKLQTYYNEIDLMLSISIPDKYTNKSFATIYEDIISNRLDKIDYSNRNDFKYKIKDLLEIFNDFYYWLISIIKKEVQF